MNDQPTTRPRFLLRPTAAPSTAAPSTAAPPTAALAPRPTPAAPAVPNAVWAPFALVNPSAAEQTPDPDRVLEVMKMLVQGYSVREIVTAGGPNVATYDEIQNWKASSWWAAMMTEAVAEVHGQSLRDALSTVQLAISSGDVATAKWYLERRDAENFGNKSQVKNDVTVNMPPARLFGGPSAQTEALEAQARAAEAQAREEQQARAAAVKAMFDAANVPAGLGVTLDVTEDEE